MQSGLEQKVILSSAGAGIGWSSNPNYLMILGFYKKKEMCRALNIPLHSLCLSARLTQGDEVLKNDMKKPLDKSTLLSQQNNYLCRQMLKVKCKSPSQHLGHFPCQIKYTSGFSIQEHSLESIKAYLFIKHNFLL